MGLPKIALTSLEHCSCPLVLWLALIRSRAGFMADGIVHGELVAVVDGPALVLDVRGREQKYPLAVDVSMAWINEHVDTPITIMVQGRKVTEVT